MPEVHNDPLLNPRDHFYDISPVFTPEKVDPIDIASIPDFEDGEKLILQYLLDHVYNGDPDLKDLAFEEFVEQCQHYEDTLSEKPTTPTWISLQDSFTRVLQPDQRAILFTRIPKGMEVTADFNLSNAAGLTGADNVDVKKILDVYGLSTVDDEGQISSPIPRERLQQLYDKLAERDEEPMHSEVKGIVVAEFMQGYSANGVLLDLNGEITNIPYRRVENFVLTGFHKDQAQRRYRELYPGRMVNLWSPETKSWHLGRLDHLAKPGHVVAELNEPMQRTNYFGESVRTSSMVVNVGTPSAYAETTAPIGLSEFDQFPDDYPYIDFSLERTDNLDIEFPEQALQGKKVIFPSGEIGNIEYANKQDNSIWFRGMKPGKDPWPISEYKLTDVGSLVSYEVLPEHPDQLPDLKNKRVRINLSVLDANLPNETYVMKIDGVFDIQGKQQILLEALPIELATKTNIPPKHFIACPVSEFEELMALKPTGFEMEKPDGLTEFKTRFPLAYKTLSEDPNFNGRAVAIVRTINGTKTGLMTQFNCLPFGIGTIGPSGNPEIVPLDRITSIQIQEII